MICEYGDNFEPRLVVDGEGTVVTAENYCVVVGGWIVQVAPHFARKNLTSYQTSVNIVAKFLKTSDGEI